MGFGAIVRTVAQMLAPFGPKVLYYDPFRADSATEEACHAEYAALETIQKCSDILSLHLAVTPQTVNMVDAGFLAGMKDGASVVFEPITYCGKCYACRCGHHNVCRELKVLGCIVDGIFQEYVVMPRSQVYEYDASKMTYQQAALCEPFTIGLQANWRGDVRPGDVVLVHGGGPIGLIVANIAKSRGATVIVSEPNESRLAMAKDFGADYSINPMKEDLDAFINKLTDGEGVNVIFEAAGVPALLAHATSQLSPAGRLVAMTFGKEPIPVNFKEINAKELTILGTRHQYQKFPEVVKILPDHLKEVDEITTHVFKAEDFQKAFDTLADRNSGAGKVVLTFA